MTADQLARLAMWIELPTLDGDERQDCGPVRAPTPDR